MNMPVIQAAFDGWFSPITLLKITQINNYGHNTSTYLAINFDGTIQPFKPRQLDVKAEGQRFWKWWMIHTQTQLALTKGDKVIYNNVRMKLMESLDYSLNGYFEYHLVEDFQDGVDI
jgi:hypothetical protein